MRKQGRRESKGRRTSQAPHLPPVRAEAEEEYYSSSSSAPGEEEQGGRTSGKPQASMRHTGSKQKGDLTGHHRRERSMKKQGEKPHEVFGFGGSGPGTPRESSQIDASPRSDAPVVHLPVTPANPRAKTGTRASFHRQAKESRASFNRQAKEAEDPEPAGQRAVHTATWTLDGVMNRPAPPSPEKRNSSVREGRQQQPSARVEGNPKRRSMSRHSLVRHQSPRVSTIGLPSGSPQQDEESSLQQLFRDAADALGQSLPPLPPPSQPPEQPPGRRASPKRMGL